MPGLEPVLRIEAALGECPLWDAGAGVLWWVDILAPALNRFDPATGANTVIAMDEHIGCVARRAGGGFVAGLRSGLWLLDEAGAKTDFVVNPQGEGAPSRFNDGRADPWGGFWAGSIWEPRDRNGAALWRLAPDHSVTEIAGDVRTSNGLGFSPDRRWAYHSDTPAHVIYRYPLDPDTGAVTGERGVWVRFPEGHGRPDGAAVDAEGCYWSALYDGGRVVRLSPEGRKLAAFPLPARCPTMVAFGGADRRTLYVTTARAGRPEAELATLPLSGSLFAMAVDVPGLPEPEFAG
jgi:sugar lactone lactonase YvrE